MSLTTEGMTPADLAAVTGNNNGFGGDGAWWLLILFLFAFGGWGNRGGYGGGGVQDGYVLASDMSHISSQISDSTNMLERRTDNISNGICNLGYTEQALANNLGRDIMQGFNTLQGAVKDCCCQTQQNTKDTQYIISQTGGDIKSAIKDCCCDTKSMFADLKYTIAQDACAIGNQLQMSTRDITDNANANTKAILDFLVNDKMSNLQRENDALRLAASQARQNEYLVGQLRPCPIPAYSVPNPYAGCGCNCNC